jgi:hypothetical protein
MANVPTAFSLTHLSHKEELGRVPRWGNFARLALAYWHLEEDSAWRDPLSPRKYRRDLPGDSMIIRYESPSDHDAIRQILIAAL